MSSRSLRILFWCLFAAVVVMAGLLVADHVRARDRVRDLADQAPLDAPTTDAESVTLDLANDDSGAIVATDRQIALPTDPSARTRALLDHLVAEYAQPGSTHPLPPGLMVNQVFLLPLPVTGHAVDQNQPASADGRVQTVPVPPTDPTLALEPRTPGGELAVIDLRSNFVNSHPSGVEVETLTLDSIIGTLHTNLPQIEQIRFLVDGQPRETLAGHADLLRTYSSRDTAAGPATP